MSNQAVLPRRSRRLATIIPASHWISIGYLEEEAQAMEKLQNDMKKYCDGGGETTIRIEGSSADVRLRHHDMLLPHWQRLFKALHGRTSTNVNSIRIYKSTLSKPVLDIMFPSLQSMNLTEICLFNVGLGNEGFQCLTSFTGKNTTLKKLVIGMDNLDDVTVATSLSDALKNHPTLDMLLCAACGLNNVTILEKILEGCTSFLALGVTMNYLGSEAIALLADFISSNHSVKVIQLQECEMTDTDAILLADALNKNTHLRDLDMIWVTMI